MQLNRKISAVANWGDKMHRKRDDGKSY